MAEPRPEERVTLAELVDRLAEGVSRRDRSFARSLASRLHQARERLSLPTVEALELTDVVATFAMDRRLRLVLTGWLPDGAGEVTIRYRERDFPLVPVALLATARDKPITWCTLDFCHRGQMARVTRAAAGIASGARVEVRALSTVGEIAQWRVRGPSGECSLAFDALELAPRPG